MSVKIIVAKGPGELEDAIIAWIKGLKSKPTLLTSSLTYDPGRGLIYIIQWS